MELQNNDLTRAVSFIDTQLQDLDLSRTTRMELMAHKRIIERILELEVQD